MGTQNLWVCLKVRVLDKKKIRELTISLFFYSFIIRTLTIAWCCIFIYYFVYIYNRCLRLFTISNNSLKHLLLSGALTLTKQTNREKKLYSNGDIWFRCRTARCTILRRSSLHLACNNLLWSDNWNR